MAIENLIIRNANREVIGIVDTAQTVIWHSRYFGVGEFEIYITANEGNLSILSEGNFVTRPDNDDIGIIESVEISFDVMYGRMISATGRFAKSILDRRLIYRLIGHTNYATTFRGKVESAARALVANNIISCDWNANRNVSFIKLGTLKNYPEVIISEIGLPADKQVSYQNLLTYTDELLKEYGLSARIILNDDTKNLEYEVCKGSDRSVENSEGNNPIIFSSDYDNLTDSVYLYSVLNHKTTALIGGEGEATERFYSIIESSSTGFNRKEVFVDAASLAREELSDSEYDEILKTQGTQTLSSLKIQEQFNGTIEITNSQYELNKDFFLGDIVTIQDNKIGKYINSRISETIEVEDENGYTVEVVYE